MSEFLDPDGNEVGTDDVAGMLFKMSQQDQPSCAFLAIIIGAEPFGTVKAHVDSCPECARAIHDAWLGFRANPEYSLVTGYAADEAAEVGLDEFLILLDAAQREAIPVS